MKFQPSVLSRVQRPLFMVGAVVLLLLLLQWNPFGATTDVQQLVAITSANSEFGTSGMLLLNVTGVEALLEVPETCIGVLFLAHGCGHAATDFWKSSTACPQCLGLPEEVNITRRALARGYAVLAVSSRDRNRTQCWQVGLPSKPSPDMLQVRNVLQLLDSDTWPQLKGKPQYAMGASSGGGFALALAALHPVAAVASQIMAVPDALLEAPPVPAGRKYPPAMFIHMPRDEYTADNVKHNLATLKTLGVATSEIRVKPHAVTAQWLQHKLGVPEDAAIKLHAAFRKANILDGHDMLVESPRESPWREAISQDLLEGEMKGMSLMADSSPLAEVLNVAFAGHEIVSDTTDAMLDWFEAQAAAVPARTGLR